MRLLNKKSSQITLFVASLLFVVSGATACFTVLMGGQIQGAPLNLTSTVSTFAGKANMQGPDNGTGTEARFYQPRGITTDGTNLYVSDTNSNTVRKIVIATGDVTTLAGTARVYGSDEGTGGDAQFYYPKGITTDGANLYVADTFNFTVRKIVIATRVVSTFAGLAGHSGTRNGTGTEARFNSPIGITTDGENLYVTDSGNNTVRKIVIATRVVSTLAGTAGVVGTDNGTGGAASFNSPRGIATDGNNLYVTDMNNNTVRKIVIATRVVSTLAGTTSDTGTCMTAAQTTFSCPVGITTDGTNLYVTDTLINIRVHKIVIATGVVSTLAGTGSYGSADGIGTAASFSDARGITSDGASLYVSDTANSTIRRIQ